MCVSVSVCVRACVRACVHVCVLVVTAHVLISLAAEKEVFKHQNTTVPIYRPPHLLLLTCILHSLLGH